MYQNKIHVFCIFKKEKETTFLTFIFYKVNKAPVSLNPTRRRNRN